MPFATISRWLRDDSRITITARREPRLGVQALEDRSVPSATLVDRNSFFSSAGSKESQLLGSSDDGRFVIFASEATDLVPNQSDTPGTRDLFWKDLLTGDTKVVTSVPTADSNGNALGATDGRTTYSAGYNSFVQPFGKAVISGDGKFVAFTSTVNASRLDPNMPTTANLQRDASDSTIDVFRWNALDSGTTAAQSVKLVSYAGGVITNANRRAFGYYGSADNPAISLNGQVVAFTSKVDGVYSTQKFTPGDTPGYGYVDDGAGSQDVFASSFNFTDQPTFIVSADRYINKTPVVTFPDGNTYSGIIEAHGLFGAADVLVDPQGRYLSVTAGTVNVAALSNYNNGFSFAPITGVSSTRYDAWDFSIPENANLNSANFALTNFLDANATPISATKTTEQAQNVIVGHSFEASFLVTAYAKSAVGVGIGGLTTAQLLNYDSADHTFNAANKYALYLVTAPSATKIVTQLVSADTTAAGTLTIDPSSNPAVPLNTGYDIAPDGHTVVFTAAGMSGGAKDQVYVRATNINSGKLDPTALVSKAASGSSYLITGVAAGASSPRVSQNGRYVSFLTAEPAATVVAGFSGTDSNGTLDVFVRDLGELVKPTAVNQLPAFFTNAVPGTSIISVDSSNVARGIGSTNGFNQYVTTIYDRTRLRDSSDALERNASVGRVTFSSVYPSLDPNFTSTNGGRSIYYVDLPVAGLPPLITPTTAPRYVIISGGVDSAIALTTFSGNGTTTVGDKITPFPGFRGELRVATADVNGDGTPDLIVAPGRGAGPRVIVFDGTNPAKRLYDFYAYEPFFTGGVNVAAADITGDGKADIVVGSDSGGGARVRVLDVTNKKTVADFFAYSEAFRGGVRVATGNILGNDTIPDVITGAGIGGGPRVSVFNGLQLRTGQLSREIDFFAFDLGLRNGVYVSAGDLTNDNINDGIDDIVVGAGPGGGPRVTAFNGASAVASPNKPRPIMDFFAFDINERNGVRVAVKNVDGDGVGDIVAGSGPGNISRIRAFSGGKLNTSNQPAVIDSASFVAFDDLASTNGAWVG